MTGRIITERTVIRMALLAVVAAALLAIGWSSPTASAQQDPPAPVLSATVNADDSVTLKLENGPSEWWYKLDRKYPCTGVLKHNNGTVTIPDVDEGTYNTFAYPDNTCGAYEWIAKTKFTVGPTLTVTFQTDDWTTDLALSEDWSKWWFMIDDATCTPARGNSYDGIRGYSSGAHSVWVWLHGECTGAKSIVWFTVPTASLSTTFHRADWSVDLDLSDGPNNWWFTIDGGTCTPASGTSFDGIRGYSSGTHTVRAYA